jgi:hypothetical protein
MSKLPSIPSFLYGKFADTKRETGKVIKALKKGKSLKEIISENYAMIELGSVTGKIVLEGPNPLYGGQKHFHMFVPGRLLFEGDDQGVDLSLFYDEMKVNFWPHLAMSSGMLAQGFYETESEKMAYVKYLIKYKTLYKSIHSHVVYDVTDCYPEFSSEEYDERRPGSIFESVEFHAWGALTGLEFIKKKYKKNELDKLISYNTPISFIQNCGIEDHLKSLKKNGL